MKTKLLLSILLFGTLLQTKAQNVLQAMKPRPADYEYLSAPDSLGVRHQLLMPNISNRNTQAAQNLPYPIIFIHGLNSNELIWGNNDPNANLIHNTLQSFNLTFGGRFDFNLNYDGNNATANKQSDIGFYTSSASAGDYYFVNFDVGSGGGVHPGGVWPLSTEVLSNQSAIAKQGYALKIAIQQVLSLTGRDKVILMGHSMGGLAAREYLQNQGNWKDPYVNHHVAKLITTGTPHGGSNKSVPFLVSLYNGLESQSEAIRDLKISYSVSGSDGVFLNGGYELNSVMNDGNNSYYNVDVNCNGSSGNSITGLNTKPSNDDIDYAYIIGQCNSCNSNPGFEPGDGVVSLSSANLSNLSNYNLPIPKNEFVFESISPIQIHTDLPFQNDYNMEALDEPNFLWLAYGVNYDKTYKGFIYKQPAEGYYYDYDDYKFTVNGNSQVSILINNINHPNLLARIFDVNANQVSTVYSGNSSLPINITQNLTSGNYYLEIYAVAPTSTATIYPYNFSLSYSLSNPDFSLDNLLNIFPNPTSSKVFFDNANSNFKEVAIYNYLGQEVSKTAFTSISTNQEVDMSSFSAGVYILKFSNTETSQSVKVVKQ
jgi:pimeloyl-ACP methyl ester carboxylesterase